MYTYIFLGVNLSLNHIILLGLVVLRVFPMAVIGQVLQQYVLHQPPVK